MNILKKTLCLLLCIVMVFSCTATAFGAEEKDTDFTYSLKYYTNKNDTYNADLLLDKADELLKELNLVYEFVIIEGGFLIREQKLVVDLTSLNSICKTIDDYKDILELVTSMPAFGNILGDLKNLNVSTWQTGLKRGTKDTVIIKELLELADANKEIVSKVCDGTLDMGIFETRLDLKELLGEDGIAGYIKKFIIGLVYDEETQSAEFNSAYNTYKNNMDAFVYGDLLGKYADEYLPGFTMDESSTVEDLICIAFGLVTEKYIEPLVKDINIDLASSEYEDLRKLHGIINLNGQSFDFSRVTLDPDKDFLSQINGVIGEIFTQLVPGYSWTDGSYDKISENIEGAFKYVGSQSGLIPDAESMSFDEITMAVIALILRNVKLDEGVSECRTLEDMAKVALINAEKELGIYVEYKQEDTYLDVMGDIAARWLYNNFSIKDFNGKTLREGMGYDIFEVANFAANYLLFDKQAAYALNLNTSKTESIFKKVDKLLDYFGETKAKGVSFDSEKFLFGKGSYKGLIDSIFSLDIQNIIEITAVPALKNAGNVSAVEFVYKCVQYALNNWSGKTMIPAYRRNAFNNALSNENIAVLVKVLLETANLRKEHIIKAVLFAGGILLKGEDINLGTPSVKIEDMQYSGKTAEPVAKVTLGGKTLTQGTDYTVYTKSVNVGKATATLKGTGLYKGEIQNISFNITPEAVSEIKVTALTENSISLSWKEVSYADSYTVYIYENSKWRTLGAVEENSYIAENLSAGTSYKFKVKVTVGATVGDFSDTVSVMTKLGKTQGLEVSSKTSTSVSLQWDKVKGATHYGVFRVEGDKWTKVATVKGDTSCTVSSLLAGQTYTFGVRAYRSGPGYGDKSETVKVTTNLKKVTAIKCTKTAESYVTLSWNKVSGATHYVVYQYKGGKWVKLKTVSTNSYTVKSLSGGKAYKFIVKAYSTKLKVYGDASSAFTARTLVGAAKGIKAVSRTASAIKLSWNKVPNATGYVVYRSTDGKTWTRVGSTKTNSITAKGLKKNKQYHFKIRAYQTVSGKNVYGGYSAVYKAKTTK